MTISGFFKKIFSPIVWGNCLGVVVVGVCLVFATLEFLQCYTDHGESVTVPNVRGQKIDVVARQLKALGLRYEVVDTGYVDTYVGDVVLDQGLRPGERVKVGRVIELTINASSARSIALPLLADNCSRREAEMKLKGLGFKNINVEFVIGDQDWVMGVKANGKDVQQGTRVPVTTLITLVIGNGDNEDHFNGNDSLDYERFHYEAPEEDETFDGSDGAPFAED